MSINLQPISNVIGALLVLLGSIMFFCIPFSWANGSGDATALLFAGSWTMIAGIVSWQYRFKSSATVNKREGYLIVALAWLSMILFGGLPYYFSGTVSSITDAVFESVSGFTTTGASIMQDIEALPHGILMWRSLTQWIGGMGIIVLTVALFPLLGIGGIELFIAEAPGPTSDKIHPRIKEVAKRLWLIYVSLTALLFVILWLEGLGAFDAFNHALTTMATGGFSTKNDSMAHYGPLVQYTIVVFMFIAGINYTVIYYFLKGRWRNAWSSDEFKMYLILVLSLTLICSIWIWHSVGLPAEQAFRDSLFQIVSLITTTGFVSADYTSWTMGLTMLFFILLFVGACAGSTSGGIKLIRHLVFLKNSLLEFKRLLHPRALIRIKINKEIVPPKVLTHILVFLLIYLFLFISGSLLVTLTGVDFLTSIGAVATSLGNVGPGIGEVGPVNNFAEMPEVSKWILSFLMLLGRLELFTILIIFSPYFWRTN
jgi:trk system potassium uptake protein TrkH